MKTTVVLLTAAFLSASAHAQKCGDVITQTVTLKKDLDCSSYSGFAALTLKEGAILKGNGKSLIAPKASVGVYAEGKTIKIHDLEIQAGPSAVGVQGYNVERLVVENVRASGMRIGVDFYTEVDYDCDRLKVVDSDLSDNDYGAKVVSPKCEYAPKFLRTDFSRSRQYALHLSARRLRVTELQGNVFDRSANGLNLKAQELIVLEGLNLADEHIEGAQVFAYSTPDVRIRNVDVGGSLGTGIELYDVGSATIRNVSAVDNAIGIKVANEQVPTKLLVAQSSTSGNATAGVLVTSFGGVPFASIDISRKNNSFRDLVSVQNQ